MKRVKRLEKDWLIIDEYNERGDLETTR